MTTCAAVLVAAALFLAARVEACTGDYNYDTRTNQADNDILKSHYGACFTYCPYDLDHSGTVDAADLAIQKTLPDCARGTYHVNAGGKTWYWTIVNPGTDCTPGEWCQCSLTSPTRIVTGYYLNDGAKVTLKEPVPAPMFCKDAGLSSEIMRTAAKVKLVGKLVVLTPPLGALTALPPASPMRPVR